jgi:hypothetical protein
MGQFQHSDRGGQADPQEALRRAREAVTREREHRHEDHRSDADEPAGGADDLEPVEEAMREHDRHSARDED